MQITRFATIFFILICFILGNGSLITAASKLILVLATMQYLLMPRTWSLSNKYIYWCIAFILFCIASTKWAYSPSTSRFYLSTISSVYICNIVLYISLKELNIHVMDWLKLLLYATVGMALYFIAIEGIHYGVSEVRGDTEINLNTIGMLSAIGASISSFQYYSNEEHRDKKLLFITFFLLFMVLLSASRKALLIPLIIFSIYKLFDGSIGRVVRNSMIAGVIGLISLWAILNVPLLYEMAGYRIEGMINGFFDTGGDVDASTNTRMLLVEFGMEKFKESKWLGYGIANFRALKDSLIGGTAYYAHNNYVELLVDIGLIGTILYYSIYIIMLYKLFGIIRNYGDSIAKYFFAMIIAVMVSHYGFVAYYSLFSNILLTIIAYYVFTYEENIVGDIEES